MTYGCKIMVSFYIIVYVTLERTGYEWMKEK